MLTNQTSLFGGSTISQQHYLLSVYCNALTCCARQQSVSSRAVTAQVYDQESNAPFEKGMRVSQQI